MKRKLYSFIAVLFGCIFALSLVACKDTNEKAQPLVIDLTERRVEEGDTLLDVMEDMQAAGEFSFTCSAGMVVEINGVKNPLNYSHCWLLYTTDTENANPEWGTYAYGEITLASAVGGVGQIPAKEGELYVWVYEKL